ncbi:hypothetical protein Tco_0871563 [Tanacetum coccineum]
MILISCISVLPSSRLCYESDLMITNVSVFVIVRGPSPIVTSNGTSPNGHNSSLKKPTRGVLESTRRDLIDDFNFRKQCSYITLHELPMSKYALFTCLPDMYTLITTGSEEPSFGMGGNVISPVLLSFAGLFFSLWSLPLTIRIEDFSNAGFSSFLLTECQKSFLFSLSPLLPDGLYLVLSLDQLGPGSRGGHSKVLATLSMDDFLSLLKLSLRSFKTPIMATSLASTQVQMCLCELLLLAKVRSELCFEIFIIKDATCLLTIPPYSGRVFEGSCRDPISCHRNQYRKAFSVHLREGNPLSNRRRVLLSLKGLGKGLKYVTVCEGQWYVPSLWKVGKASPHRGFPSEFAERSPWTVY